MDDPGLDEPIKEVGQVVNGQKDGYDGTEEEEEKKFLDPSRWYFASTAAPLIAGTLGPVANAFNICAVNQSWREKFDHVEDAGVSIKDPPWLLALNAVSLVCAICANMSLLLNMGDRLRFSIAQPVTISGFTSASLILIGLVIASSTNQGFHPHHTHGRALTQGFYYAIFAAVLYFIVALLMVWNVWGALKGKHPRQFNLTTSQRTLMLQTIALMVYLLLGAFVFSRIESWKYLDALYWADYTLLTVGIGVPFAPLTHAGRALLFPYAIGGIVTVGLVIGSIRSMVLEQGKEKMHARATEKRREHVADSSARRSSTSINMDHGNRRRYEFHRMRRVLANADRKSRWRSLALSTLAACVLWFIGALVFMYTEHQQGWTYFVSLYFSYTTLLTIGYGDFAPMSNAGRAFFVLWTLLAVPTLTILISDMGDTVVKAFVQATNWIGSLSFLPGQGAWQSIKTHPRLPSKAGAVSLFSGQGTTQNPEMMEEAKAVGSHDSESQPVQALDAVADILRERLTDEELSFCNSLQDNTSLGHTAKDKSFYRWLLSREVTVLLDDVEETPPRLYTYEEWTYFLLLLGHDEDGARRNRDLAGKPKRGAHGPELGCIVDREGNIRHWSWLGIRSPLISARKEADWLLHQISARLQRVLRKERAAGEQAEEEEVPVRLATLFGRHEEADGEDQ